LLTSPGRIRSIVQARRDIINNLYANEDYFLQIDSHTRFKDNWDNILINQIQSIPKGKVIISTYPNEFTYPDPDMEYLKLPYNAPLIFDKFFTDDPRDNRFVPRNLRSLKDYDVVENKRISAGFLFTDARWIQDVAMPKEGIIFNGEEDFLTYLSYLKGWNITLPSEAVVWHNYDRKDRKGVPYRSFNKNLGKGVEDRSIDIINDVLFNQKHVRSLEELENYLGVVFKKQKITF
jgi:hypothetical protein